MEVIAPASIPGEPRRTPPVILEKCPKRLDRHVTVGIPDEDAPASAWYSCNKIFQSGARCRAKATTLCGEGSPCESDATLSIAVAQVVGAPMTEFTTEAEGVFAVGVGNIVYPLIGLVGSREQRPAMVTAELSKTPDVNFWHAKIDGISNASVDAIHRLGVFVMVCRENGLPKPHVTETRLVCPLRCGDPNVIQTEDLGAKL